MVIIGTIDKGNGTLCIQYKALQLVLINWVFLSTHIPCEYSDLIIQITILGPWQPEGNCC